MFPYGVPPGYNPHHPRPSAVDDVTDASRHQQARLDGGQWVSRDGEWIYHLRYGDHWRAHWVGGGYGAWERAEGLPEGVVRL